MPSVASAPFSLITSSLHLSMPFASLQSGITHAMPGTCGDGHSSALLCFYTPPFAPLVLSIYSNKSVCLVSVKEQ